jgi:large subunit ribosomal protein L14
MLMNESQVVICDNTGAKKWKVIRILKGSNWKKASVWDLVVIAIKDASPTSSVKKWDTSRALIVRVRKEIGRKDGTYVRFWDNAVVLMSKDAKWELKPIWKRVFWPVAKELRLLGYRNITNMAEEVV